MLAAKIAYPIGKLLLQFFAIEIDIIIDFFIGQYKANHRFFQYTTQQRNFFVNISATYV